MPLYRPHPLTSLTGYSAAYFTLQGHEPNERELHNDAIWRPDLSPNSLANLEQEIAMSSIPRIFRPAEHTQIPAAEVPGHVHDQLQAEYRLFSTRIGYMPSARLLDSLIRWRPTQLSLHSWVLNSLVSGIPVPSGAQLTLDDLSTTDHNFLGYTYVAPDYLGAHTKRALEPLRCWAVYLAVAVEARMVRLLSDYDEPRVDALNEAEGRAVFETSIPIHRMYESRVAEALGAAWFDLGVPEETLDRIRDQLRVREVIADLSLFG